MKLMILLMKMIRINDKEKEDGLVIDEQADDDDDEDIEVDDDEPLSPGGPENEQQIQPKPSTRKSEPAQIEPMDSSPPSSATTAKSTATPSVGSAANNPISKAPME